MWAALLGALAVFPAGNAAAQGPQVSVAMTGSPNATLKHNDPCGVGSPRAMYVTYRVTNTSGATLTNLRATISGFASGFALAGGQQATQFFGALPAGGQKTLYWYIQYPCSFNISSTLTVAVSSGGAATTGSGTVTTRQMQATGTGGQLMSALLGAGAVVGQTISLDVSYTFGNTQVGDEFDHQPAGNVGFNAGCFQLMGTQIVSSQSNGVPAGAVNQTYFVSSVSQGGSGHQVVVRYFFKYLCAGVTSVNRPYANQTSGSNNLKYSSNFDTFVGPTLPIATNPFSMQKTASPKQMPTPGTVTYTIVVTNPSAFAAEADSIVDLLPAGMAFSGFGAGSQVTAANSGSVPAAGATGRIVFRGIPGLSGTQPGSYLIPPNGTLTLVYTATTASAGRYVNSASGFTGSTNIGNGADTVVVGTANLAVAKTGPDSVVVADTLVYVLVTSNAGPNTAFDVVVRDSLPAGVTFLSATGGATVSGRTVTWPAWPSLASGASLRDTVRVTAPATLDSLVNIGRARSTTFDSDSTNNNGSASGSRVTTRVVGPIVVTPDGLPEPIARLPGVYAQVFTVNHRGGAASAFDLLAARRGIAGLLVIDSIRGTGAAAPAADSARLTLPARTVRTYTVWYTVPMGDTATGATHLLARSVPTPAYADSGWAELRRAFPTLTLTRSVSPAGVVAPGSDLVYTLQFANVGHYAATGVRLVEAVPPQVLFRLGSVAPAFPPGITATVEYSSDDGTSWSYVPVSGSCGAPSGFDGCVNAFRLNLAVNLPPGAGSSTTTVSYEARIR